MSPHEIRLLADVVSAFGRTWGTGYLNRLVTDGQITQDDADRVLLHTDFGLSMPIEWQVTA